MAEKQNIVVTHLRQLAEKVASEKQAAGEGAPDRMTVDDGQGGITTSKATVPKDPGECEVKSEMPTDGTPVAAAGVPTGGPDRMTVADGQGGVTAAKGTVPKDPGEGEVKSEMPTDGSVRKAAADRILNIRNALSKANPEIGARIQKAAGGAQPAPAAPTVAAPSAPVKSAGQPDLDLSKDVLAKIASVMLSTDDGIRHVHNTLVKQAGEDAARAQIQDAILAAQHVDEIEHVKMAAYDDFSQKAQAIYGRLGEVGVGEAEAGEILKQAAYQQNRINSFEHPMLKQAYMQGMDDAALMAAADDAAGEEGVPPVEEALPMGGENLSEEEILQLLTEMLDSGQITEEDIAEAVGAVGGAEGAEEMAPEMVPA